MSISYRTARISDDATCVRNRTGTLPPKPSHNVPAWCFGAGLALGWGLGLICGMGVL